MNETDLPCPDCGTALTERTVQAHDLPLDTERRDTVTIAECPSCGCRYYPERALARLYSHRDDNRSRGGS